MPRPDRTAPQGQAQAQQGGGMSVGGVREDIRALNSSILLMAQKMKYLVRNEKILGRNLIVLNKKIKALEDKLVNPQGMPLAGGGGAGVSSEEVVALTQKVSLLEAQLSDYKSMTATKEELKELKYVIDSINPLEFTTLTQVRELIDKRLAEQGSAVKKK